MAYVQPFPLASPLQTPHQPIYAPDLAVRLICPDCKDPHPNIIEEYSSGDLVCGSCGLVLGDRIVDDRSEWRTFADNDGDDPSRVGTVVDPLMLGMEQLDTDISFKDNHSGVARELRRAVARSSGTRTQRTLVQAFNDITAFCDQFSMPKTIADFAKQLFKRAAEEKLLRARSQQGIIAACVFIACRHAGVDRTFKEIADLARIDKKVLGKCFTVLSTTFSVGSKASVKTAAGSAPETVGPEVHLGRFLNHLGLPHKFEPICAEIIRRGRLQALFEHRKPLTILGAVIYFTSHLLGDPRSFSELKPAIDVGEGTIRQVYRCMYKHRDSLIKEEWITKGIAHVERLPE
ncbi:hypothetical protein QCA50_015324 [Cerrena zonata]|uniref:General transcription factor TFIIB n=1 Tax=Cerrena zonata TaxID=2478898 RepID=A0AAW0FLS1_9APHY